MGGGGASVKVMGTRERIGQWGIGTDEITLIASIGLMGQTASLQSLQLTRNTFLNQHMLGFQIRSTGFARKCGI